MEDLLIFVLWAVGLWLFYKLSKWLFPSTYHSDEDPFRKPPF